MRVEGGVGGDNSFIGEKKEEERPLLVPVGASYTSSTSSRMQCPGSDKRDRTRYDIAYAVNRCAQFLENPTQGTVEAIKRIMAYLVGTLKKRLSAVQNGVAE